MSRSAWSSGGFSFRWKRSERTHQIRLKGARMMFQSRLLRAVLKSTCGSCLAKRLISNRLKRKTAYCFRDNRFFTRPRQGTAASKVSVLKAVFRLRPHSVSFAPISVNSGNDRTAGSGRSFGVIAYDKKLACLGVKSHGRSGSQLALGGRVKSDRKRLANLRSPSICNESSAAPP